MRTIIRRRSKKRQAKCATGVQPLSHLGVSVHMMGNTSWFNSRDGQEQPACSDAEDGSLVEARFLACHLFGSRKRNQRLLVHPCLIHPASYAPGNIWCGTPVSKLLVTNHQVVALWFYVGGRKSERQRGADAAGSSVRVKGGVEEKQKWHRRHSKGPTMPFVSRGHHPLGVDAPLA